MNKSELGNFPDDSKERKKLLEFKENFLKTVNKLKRLEQDPVRNSKTEQKVADVVNKSLRRHKIDVIAIEAEGIMTVELKPGWEQLRKKNQPFAWKPEYFMPTLATPYLPRLLLEIVQGGNIVGTQELDKIVGNSWYISCEGFKNELLLVPVSEFQKINVRLYKERFSKIPWPNV